MGDKTGISWSDATWNPFVGCSNVSPACKRCYAMSEAHRQVLMAKGLGRTTHYEGTVQLEKGRPVFTGVVNLAPENILLRPITWTRPRLVFVNSVSDVFHENVPKAWVDRVMATIAIAKNHRFQVLTKRPLRMATYFAHLYNEGWEEFLAMRPSVKEGQPNGPLTVSEWLVRNYGSDRKERFLPNLWLGATVEDQRRADERIPVLLKIQAAVLWVSMEPLLGKVDLTLIKSGTGNIINALTGEVDGVAGANGKLGWVITGGESGKDSRPMHPSWIRKIRDDTNLYGTPHHFKQWGNWVPAPWVAMKGDEPASHTVSEKGRVAPAPDLSMTDGLVGMRRTGKKNAGRFLDGEMYEAMPAGFLTSIAA